MKFNYGKALFAAGGIIAFSANIANAEGTDTHQLGQAYGYALVCGDVFLDESSQIFEYEFVEAYGEYFDFFQAFQGDLEANGNTVDLLQFAKGSDSAAAELQSGPDITFTCLIFKGYIKGFLDGINLADFEN